MRWTGNFEVELGRGMHDFGVEEHCFSGVEGSDGSWSSVEKEARDVGCRRPECREPAETKLNGDKRSSELSSLYNAVPTTAGDDILRMFAPLRSCCISPDRPHQPLILNN